MMAMMIARKTQVQGTQIPREGQTVVEAPPPRPSPVRSSCSQSYSPRSRQGGPRWHAGP